MLNSNSNLQALNYLREICRKRKEGYTKAAEIVKKPDIEKLFINYAKQSDDFEYELMHFSDDKNAHPNSESFDIFRLKGWRYFDDDLENLTLENIISVCEKEEKATIGDYEDMLEEELPDDIEVCINRQLIEITDAYDTILGIKNEMRPNNV